MKKILVSMLAVAALVACQKENSSEKEIPEMGNFEVVLPDGPQTMAVESEQAAGTISTTYNDVATYLVDNGGNAVLHAWTADEITAKKKTFEQIVKPSKVIVIVNKNGVILPASAVESNLKASLINLTAASQNAGLATITLMGESAAANFTESLATDGHQLFTAAVTLSSLVSRFEVGTIKAGTGMKSITVKDVYLNNFYTTYAMNGANTQSFTETNWPTSFSPAWAHDAASAEVNSQAGTKCYAYQVFTGDMIPHIVYRVSGELEQGYKLADGTEGTFNDKFITVTGFSVNGNKLVGRTAGAGEYQMKANEIYKLGLTSGGIEITPDKVTDNPEKGKIDLVVNVTVAPWTVQTVTPQI